MSKQYRILAVAATPFFVDRGGHIHIYEQIRALKALGNEVTLVTYHIGRDLPDVDTRRIINIPWYTKTDAGPSYQKPYMALLLLFKSMQVAREIKPDIVHAHGWDSMWVAWWLWKLMGIPFVLDMQGSFSGEIAEHGYAKKDGLFYKFLSAIENISLKASPIVMTSSTQIYLEARERFHLSDEHLLAILDGVDTETYSPERCPFEPELFASLNLPEEKPLIVFTGLLKTYQGVDDMLEALRIMVYERQFTHFHLLLIGFPDQDKYEAIAREKGITEYITFHGKVPYEHIGRYLALADVGIAPKISMTEGDAKIYFYMALGLPVVAYRRPASVEILKELGIYADYHNPADLARVLCETLSNPELMQQRGLENRQRAVQTLSWHAVAIRIMDAYARGIARIKRMPIAASAKAYE